MNKKPTPILVKKSVKHFFTPEELAVLNVDFGNAYDAVKSAEADFDAIKAVHKGKIQEAESKMTTLRATINAKFEYREKELEVVFRPADKKKDYYLPEHGDHSPVVLTEDMTQDDFQQDLLQAESVFSKRRELNLWAAGDDRGTLIVGQLGNRWYSALRGNIGAVKLEERLDSEQKAFKAREAAVNTACTRALEWIAAMLGDEAAKGFTEGIRKLAETEAGKVE